MIDPKTAEIMFSWGEVLYPYGSASQIPEDEQCIGRIYFARQDGSEEWTCFYDLPAEIRNALWEEIRAGRFAEHDIPF